MEHIAKPVTKILDDVQVKMLEDRQRREKRTLAIRLKKKKRPRIKNPGQRDFSF